MSTHLLFVCSKHEWRSRIAASIYRHTPHSRVQSAGTSPTALVTVSQSLLDWADVVFVMEPCHQ